MNIFAVNSSPVISAQQLPDKHIVKMPLECCQMAAMVFSKYRWDFGTIPKANGEPYKVSKNSPHLVHPCTVWVSKSTAHMAWMLMHGLALCEEYTYRYNKFHACENALQFAVELFADKTGLSIFNAHNNVVNFTRAMPDYIKNDTSINDHTAYKLFINTKPWAYDNYIRIPERRPSWLLKTLP